MEIKISQEMSGMNVGTIQTNYTELYVEWKIPNFLSLPQIIDDYIESSLFHFCGATWYLVIYPRGECDIESRSVNAYLRKVHTDTKIRGIQYRIGIKKRDGSEHWTNSDETEFEDYQSESEDDESESEDNDSEKFEYDSGDEQSSLRVKHMVKRSVIRSESNMLLPKGVLTAFCILRAIKIGNKEAERYTEIPVGSEKCVESKGKDPEENDGATVDVTSPKPTGIDKLVSDLKHLLTCEKNSDVTLKVEDKEFRAHINILRTRSSVFYSMFDHDMAEKNSGTVDIPDCNPEAFQYFLTYIYTASIDSLSNDIVLNLYFIADKYDTEELKHTCVEFMANNLSVDTFCDVVALSLKYEESALLQTATDFFTKNTKEVIVSVQWQSFLKDYPVTANELYIKSFDSNVMHK